MSEADEQEHQDNLSALNEQLSLREKVLIAHKSVKQLFPFIDRIAIAVYDPQTKVLKTYVHSSGKDNPLEHYQALLDDAPSLKQILEKKLPRVINNMLTFDDGQQEHSKRLGRQGYAASYTMPMFNNGSFFGFIFFNSYQQDVFSEGVLRELDLYGHMISLMVINELSSILALTAAVRTTGHLAHVRDPETGSHLDRMSRYSRLIALELANKHELDDAYIEHIFMFSPLHDLGKIGIPDKILLKPGELAEHEAVVMRQHARLGREMIDEIVKNFGLENIPHVDILKNIAEFHHESINGEGYPYGKSGEEIPLEARIVAVADVFDALTSKRPYKEAWPNEEAIAMLKTLAGEKLDRDCVNALIKHLAEVEEIQQKFKEDPFG